MRLSNGRKCENWKRCLYLKRCEIVSAKTETNNANLAAQEKPIDRFLSKEMTVVNKQVCKLR